MLKMFQKKKDEFAGWNILDLKPERLFEYEVQADEKVVLLIPKFRDRILGKYLQPYIRRKFYKVKLDKLGSQTWLHCDGKTPVSKIADKLREKFGADAEPADERVAKFVQHLYRGDCVKLNK